MVARRALLKTAAASAAGLPLAAVLADPLLTRAAAQTTEPVTVTTPSGRPVSAALALPATTPAGSVLLIHEWWGLNDQIRAVGAELAQAGYIALAVDLMDGQVATAPDQAQAQANAVQTAQATETLVTWLSWLGHLRNLGQASGKVATCGWCFGGGWSLQASLAVPVDGTVIYYGRVPDEAAALATLRGPVLGHFASRDQFITRTMVEGFVRALEAANKPHEIYWYDAEHAFANPTGANYHREDAQLAWQRTLDFLRRTIG